jgi:hypothetical protein
MTVYQGSSVTPELTATGYALFRAGVKVSAGTVDALAASLRRRHEKRTARWRLLSPAAQAVLVIAFLRTNLTCAELAGGCGISPSACWRGIREGISVLAGRGRRITLKDGARLAVKTGGDYVIVDGTHVPTATSGRGTGGQKACYSGTHQRHGLNVPAVCSPDGELLWAAAPAPGAAVDVTAARRAGIAAMLVSVTGVLADLGYPGWDEQVITGLRQPRGKEMTAAQRAANRLQAQLRCVGERGNARLKVLESPGHRAALPPGAVHRDGQGDPGAALPRTRPVRCPARRVMRPDRYQAATRRHNRRRIREALENYPEPGQRTTATSGRGTGPQPAGTQDARGSMRGLRRQRPREASQAIQDRVQIQRTARVHGTNGVLPPWAELPLLRVPAFLLGLRPPGWYPQGRRQPSADVVAGVEEECSQLVNVVLRQVCAGHESLR